MIVRPLVIAEGSWCLDIETAWSRLFQIMVRVMGQAYSAEVSIYFCYSGILYCFFQIMVTMMGGQIYTFVCGLPDFVLPMLWTLKT